MVADARGTFLPLPDAVQTETMARYPEFIEYWKR